MKLSRTLPRPRLASALPRRTPAIVVGLVLGLLAIWLAAYWLSKIIAPRPVASLPDSRPAERAIASDAAQRIFASAGNAQPGTALGNIVLTGIFAGHDGRGFATFRLPQGPKGAVVGQEVAPGVTLARADKDSVTLRAGGVEHTLALVKDNTSAAAQPAANPAASTANRDH